MSRQQVLSTLKAQPPGFDRYVDLKFFLEELIGRPVDLVTRGGLRSEFRARVEGEAINVA